MDTAASLPLPPPKQKKEKPKKKTHFVLSFFSILFYNRTPASRRVYRNRNPKLRFFNFVLSVFSFSPLGRFRFFSFRISKCQKFLIPGPLLPTCIYLNSYTSVPKNQFLFSLLRLTVSQVEMYRIER